MPWKEVSSMEERTKFVFLAEAGKQSFAQLCRDFGISRKSGYKWLERKRRLGLAGLGELSRRPSGNSRAIGEKVEKLILQLKRRHRSWGAKKLHDLLVGESSIGSPPCVNTVGNVLKRYGLTRPPRRRRPGLYKRQSHELTRAQWPNHVWAVDFKGWFMLGDKMCCDPLTISDLHSRYIVCCKAPGGQRHALSLGRGGRTLQVECVVDLAGHRRGVYSARTSPG